jgi:hypothetical protein
MTIDVEMDDADFDNEDVSDLLEGAWIYDEEFRGVVLKTSIVKIGRAK